MSRVKLFTHNDLDAVGCAILAYLVFGRENVDVEYCGYDDVEEKVEKFWTMASDVEYDVIFITDISISDDLAKLIDRSFTDIGKWYLFDHHATANRLIKYRWCNVRVTNDIGIKTSGTELFFRYLTYDGILHPATWDIPILENIERFVEIVRDYDTWRWKEDLGEEGIVCKQVNDLFYIYGRDKFIDWALNQIIGVGFKSPLFRFPTFSETDKALLEQHQKDIDIYVEQKNNQLLTRVDHFDNVYGIVFAERYFSELGNRLSERHPELAYIAMIDICNGKVSYRTVHDDIDLGGTIAHSFGGGGHAKAAGWTFDANEMHNDIFRDLFPWSKEE